MPDVKPLTCSNCPVAYVVNHGGSIETRCAFSGEVPEHGRGCWMVNTERAYVLLDFIARAAVTLDEALAMANVGGTDG